MLLLNYYALWKGWEIKLTMMTSLQNIDDRGANDPAVHPLCRGPLIRTLEPSSYTSFQCLYCCFWVFCYMSIMETQKKNCEIYWQLTVKVPERPQWLRICAFFINFEHISHIVMVFPLLAGTEPVNIDWVKP